MIIMAFACQIYLLSFLVICKLIIKRTSLTRVWECVSLPFSSNDFKWKKQQLTYLMLFCEESSSMRKKRNWSTDDMHSCWCNIRTSFSSFTDEQRSRYLLTHQRTDDFEQWLKNKFQTKRLRVWLLYHLFGRVDNRFDESFAQRCVVVVDNELMDHD